MGVDDLPTYEFILNSDLWKGKNLTKDLLEDLKKQLFFACKPKLMGNSDPILNFIEYGQMENILNGGGFRLLGELGVVGSEHIERVN